MMTVAALTVAAQTLSLTALRSVVCAARPRNANVSQALYPLPGAPLGIEAHNLLIILLDVRSFSFVSRNIKSLTSFITRFTKWD